MFPRLMAHTPYLAIARCVPPSPSLRRNKLGGAGFCATGGLGVIPLVPAVDGRAGCTDLDCYRSRWSHSEEAN